MQRVPGNEFVHCGGFQSLCRHRTGRKFDPSSVEAGEIVYCRDHWSAFFRKTHPDIQVPYVLLSNFHDARLTHFAEVDDGKLLHWFGNNVDCEHPKITCIPHGLKYRERIEPYLKDGIEKDILLYANFNVESKPQIRKPLWGALTQVRFCTLGKYDRNAQGAYVEALQRSVFVVSPPGGGEDCYRTWEALACGAIPVVRTSFLDSLLGKLPVLILKDWSELTEQRLQDTLTEFECKTFHYDLLRQSWWDATIRSTARRPGNG